MGWIKTHSVSAVICGLTLLVPILLYLQLSINLLSLRAEYQGEVEKLEPRVARLVGLFENENLMRASDAELQGLVARRVYPPGLDRASISATLQKELKQVFSDAGMSVSNSQVLPLRKEQRFDQIMVRYTVTGTMRGLDDALRRIAEYSPLVLVESLELSPRRVRTKAAPSQTVTATLQLLSLGAIE
jgi:general secretion pathway protein M